MTNRKASNINNKNCPTVKEKRRTTRVIFRDEQKKKKDEGKIAFRQSSQIDDPFPSICRYVRNSSQNNVDKTFISTKVFSKLVYPCPCAHCKQDQMNRIDSTRKRINKQTNGADISIRTMENGLLAKMPLASPPISPKHY